MEVKDGAQTGLFLRVGKTRRAFLFRWRDRKTGRLQEIALGLAGDAFGAITLHEARGKAAEAHALTRQNRHPRALSQKAESEKRKMPTLEAFVEEFIEKYSKPNKKSWKEDQRLLDKEVIPRMGLLRLDEIGRRDVVELLDKVRDRGAPIMANRLLAVVRRMFKFSIERGILEVSPVIHIKAQAEKSRERVLTDDEIKLVWNGTMATSLGTSRRLALRLLLLTGSRPGEVAGMVKSEIDLERGIWNLPGERSKNGLPRSLPLAPETMKVIEEALKEAGDSDFIFPRIRGNGPVKVGSLNEGVMEIFKGKEDKPHSHDLRRTLATRLAELGVPRLVIEKILNHKDRSVAGIYDRHSYENEMRKALVRWERELRVILGEKAKEKVVPLRG